MCTAYRPLTVEGSHGTDSIPVVPESGVKGDEVADSFVVSFRNLLKSPCKQTSRHSTLNRASSFLPDLSPSPRGATHPSTAHTQANANPSPEGSLPTSPPHLRRLPLPLTQGDSDDTGPAGGQASGVLAPAKPTLVVTTASPGWLAMDASAVWPSFPTRWRSLAIFCPVRRAFPG